jgi:endoglucanase
MRDLTSVQLALEMAPGINLGNTLEAIPTETSWGQPPTTQATMDGFRAAGFRTVRIPVAWSQYADANDTIDAAWMARVRQVVDEARHAGLYAIVNIHWDGGWMNHPTYAQQAAINARLARFWTQIATEFRDDDDHLLFAGSNEVAVEGVYSAPTAENLAVQDSFNQTFVDTVRATGGNNRLRHLVVQGYATNIAWTVAGNHLPHDTASHRLFMELHYYDPYDFTINANSAIWQWGRRATDPAATETWADEPWVDQQFQSLKTAYADQGVAVLIGEYGAYPKAAYPEMASFLDDWTTFVTGSIHRHGLVPVWWDTGALIDRTTGAVKDATTVGLIMAAGR